MAEPTQSIDRPIRVLMICYVCGPRQGSEPNMAWTWLRELDEKGIEITAFSSQQFRQSVEKELRVRPLVNSRIEFVDRVDGPISRRFGSFYVSLAYMIWQLAALTRAFKLHRSQPFDIAHHVSYGSISRGTLITFLPVPTIVGPMGGGQVTPKGFDDLMPTEAGREARRSTLVRLTRWNPLLRMTTARADTLLAANEDTRSRMSRLGMNAKVLLDTGSNPSPGRQPRTRGSGPLRLIWVGRVFEFKGLGLALMAVEQAARSCDVHLTICGTGPGYKSVAGEIERLERSGVVNASGWLDEDELRQTYERSEAILYTSLRDNGGAPLLTASEMGLPAITLDHQGPGAIVSDRWGLKTKPIRTSTTASDLAGRIVTLSNDNALYERLSAGAINAAWENTWPVRADRLVEEYKKLAERL